MDNGFNNGRSLFICLQNHIRVHPIPVHGCTTCILVYGNDHRNIGSTPGATPSIAPYGSISNGLSTFSSGHHHYIIFFVFWCF